MNGNGNGDETQAQPDETTSDIVPGGPTDCQRCGKPVTMPPPFGLAKKVGPSVFVAALCADCAVVELGLEWRALKRSGIVVPGQQKGMM